MLLSRGGFEGTRPRAQKKSEAKIKNRSLENRPQRGQKHECLGKDTTRKCSPKKNTSLLKKLQIFRETPAFSKKRKNLRSKKSQIFSKKKRCQIFFASFLAGHFRELAGFEAKFKDFKLVLQDSTSAIKLGTKFSSAKT